MILFFSFFFFLFYCLPTDRDISSTHPFSRFLVYFHRITLTPWKQHAVPQRSWIKLLCPELVGSYTLPSPRLISTLWNIPTNSRVMREFLSTRTLWHQPDAWKGDLKGAALCSRPASGPWPVCIRSQGQGALGGGECRLLPTFPQESSWSFMAGSEFAWKHL